MEAVRVDSHNSCLTRYLQLSVTTPQSRAATSKAHKTNQSRSEQQRVRAINYLGHRSRTGSSLEPQQAAIARTSLIVGLVLTRRGVALNSWTVRRSAIFLQDSLMVITTCVNTQC